jgi:hypothetical protein
MKSLLPLRLSLLLVLPAQATAQVPDSGVFVLRSGDREVGTESFTVASDSGVRISSKTTFATRPAIELTASLVHPKGSGLAFQLERQAGKASGQVYAVQKRNRITVRRVDAGAEKASELPSSPRMVMLADSVFALYLQVVPLATEAGQAVEALFPQEARRVAFRAQRVATGTSGAVIRLSGGVEGELELGNHDQVQRISIPALRLEAVRRPN